MEVRRNRLFIAAGLAVIVIILAGSFVLSILPVSGRQTVRVVLPKGAGAREMGRILSVNHVIRSPFAFRIMARLTGKGNRLHSGAYDFQPGTGLLDVLRKIETGEVSAKWITFPEGFTIRQMGERLESAGAGSADKFEKKALYDGASFNTNFAQPGQSLEGYLFPDTYLVPLGTSEDGVIREMLESFDTKVVQALKDDIKASGMSLKDVVTLASLIEREARIPKDRPLIAAVLLNRMKKHMRLECDATILYALGKHKNRVLFKDLEIDSPYNTYRNAGLPPGPIANPGLDSIKAALHPAAADYLYYVARSDGSHIFSRTFEEHQHAKVIARRKEKD